MHIKKIFRFSLILTSALIIQFFSNSIHAQIVWENPSKEVYNYLSRMSQKGLIRFDDNIRPLSRKYLAECLDSLLSNEVNLSVIEKKELQFYLQEYGIETHKTDSTERVKFFKKDKYQRWRMISASGNGNTFQVDPVITAAIIQGTGMNVRSSSSGINLYGNVGKHWGFQFYYNDVTESGTGFDSTRKFSPNSGIIRKDKSVHTSQNFSQLRGSISYSWKSGSLSFGQDQLLWGMGEYGKIVLSDKPPAYPFIRLDFKLFPWLSFNYAHTWLNSALIDSNRTYGTGNTVYGGERQFYIKKFLATHSLQIKINKGLDFAVGESIVYSDRLDVGYLFPIMFFKVYDNIINNSNILTGSNGQVFFQLNSRNQLPKTHLYSTLFIDEIRVSTIFDKNKSRNQLGFTLGGSVTDVFIPYLTIGLEYTRMNPFTYQNLIPAQNYTSYDYSLGDWMGNNFDRLTYSLKYTPIPRLKCRLTYQLIRKGGAGTVEQQYFQQPQPSFLFDKQFSQKEISANITYELINNLNIYGIFSSKSINNYPSLQNSKLTNFNVGFTYGL